MTKARGMDLWSTELDVVVGGGFQGEGELDWGYLNRLFLASWILWSSLAAWRVKNLVSLPWWGFNPWPGNFHMPRGRPNKTKTKAENQLHLC